MSQMTPAALLAELCPLQDAFNKRINPDWLHANFLWNRAIWMECAELIEGTNSWKWWKAPGEYSQAQIKLEVIDILHFLLSWALVEDAYSEMEGKPGVAILLLTKHLSPPQFATGFDVEVVMSAAEKTAGWSATEEIDRAIMGFSSLVYSAGLNLAEIREIYVGKNALNTFRNLNGYKAGTYIKHWNGVEDNVHLENIMRAHPEYGFDRLIEALGDLYQQLAMPQQAPT